VLLDQIGIPGLAAGAAVRACEFMRALYPLCRSITGAGVRQTLDLLGERIPLRRIELPTGTPLFDWEVPKEWTIRDAYISDSAGRRIVDFLAHNLHVVNYSAPVHQTMTLDELQPHLHSLPEHPDWIPYRTTYWRENWGFCLRHRDRERLQPGTYEVAVDSTLAAGSLTYAECIVRGTTPGQAIVYTHTCHPSLVNDNLTGIAVSAAIAKALQGARPRLTWRFVFGPGTLGSLAWLSQNESALPDLRAGLTLGLLGDTQPLTYKRSRRGQTPTDRAAELVLSRHSSPTRIVDFEPYGYDERQFCSPGFDLPVGRLSRAQHGEYPQYHTSADNLDFVSPNRLAESLAVTAQLISVIDANRTLVNLSPKGEPRLGKRGLYGSLGGKAPAEFEQALLWLLSLSDGAHDLIAIAHRANLPFHVIDSAATALDQAGLVRALDKPHAHAPSGVKG
jgi:aminopeptidase-like protein